MAFVEVDPPESVSGQSSQIGSAIDAFEGDPGSIHSRIQVDKDTECAGNQGEDLEAFAEDRERGLRELGRDLTESFQRRADVRVGDEEVDLR